MVVVVTPAREPRRALMGMLGRRAGKRVKAVGVGGRLADSNNKLGGAAFVTTWASGRVSEPSQRRVLV